MNGGGIAGRPLPVLIAAVLICGAIVVGTGLIAPVLLGGLGDWSPAVQEALFALLVYGLLAVAGAVGRRLASIDRAAAPRALVWIALGLSVGIGGFLLALGDAVLAGSVIRGMARVSSGALLLGTVVTIGQSASEELFFRGWLQPVLQRGWGPVAAIAVTAVTFAGLHVAGGVRGALELINLALGGVLFGLLAWRSGGIAASIAAHAGWNWSEGILFGLDPNPGTGSFGALHDLELGGSALWGGSASGLNASVAMTIVLVALVLPLLSRVSPSSSSAHG